MASPIKGNDEQSWITNAEETMTTTTMQETNEKNLATTTTIDANGTVTTNGTNNTEEEKKAPQQQQQNSDKTGGEETEGAKNTTTTTPSSQNDSAAATGNENSTTTNSVDSSPIRSIGSNGTTTTNAPSAANSPQTPVSASAPRSKPKPLKLPENSSHHHHQQQQFPNFHQHHHQMSQSQALYPGAAGFGPFGGGGPQFQMGAMSPHAIFVGGGGGGAGGLMTQHSVPGHHVNHQYGGGQQQQQQSNNNAGNHASMVGPGGDGGGGGGGSTAAASTDEILETMELINRSVKAGQFSTNLAGHIFRLYNYLKHVGELFEQSHKTEMNRVFVSLRQACCRDSGQLGTPCRLKIMELVELRAMGWRPNLAHSQYYLNRGGGGGSLTNGGGSEFNPICSMDVMSGGDMELLGAAPVSAPPFGTFPMNPFAFNVPPTSMAGGGGGPVASASDLVSTAAAAAAVSIAATPQGPQYYLIPASHVGHHNQAGIAFISPTAAATVLPPPPPLSPMANNAAAVAMAAAAAHHQQRLHMPVSASLSHPAVTSTTNGGGGGVMNPRSSPSPGPKGSATAASKAPAGKFPRPAKLPGKGQYRTEVIIRNADSGKIMGVKGRRVAIIEELSKTIISFQKVPQGAKERLLTITGPSEEAIVQAKTLIEDTIRRNVSPIRGEGEGESGSTSDYRRASVLATRMHSEDDAHSTGGDGGGWDDVSGYGDVGENGKENSIASGDGGSDGGNNSELTFEAGKLGEMLKLQCSDPALLEAAKQALSAFFSGQQPQRQPQGHSALRRTTTDAANRDQVRKERRKSMPMLENQHRALGIKQSSPPDGADNSLAESSAEEAAAAGAQYEQENADGSGDDKAGEQTETSPGKQMTLTMMISPQIGKQKASSAARSTPNLAASGYNKRALSMMMSMDSSNGGGSTPSTGGSLDHGGGVGDVETKFLADESGGGTLVVHEKKSRVTVRVVYTREFVLQCAASPFAAFTPAGLPWMSRETPDILRPVPGKFDINGYKQSCSELRQQQQ